MLESIDKQTSKIFWAVLAKDAESTLSLYLDCLYQQDYDKSLITIYFRTNDNSDNTEQIIEKFISNHGHEYGKIIFDSSSVDARLKDFDNHEWNPLRFAILGSIRNKSLELALESDCDFYFVSDVDNFIIPQTLSSLVGLNLEIVAPLLHNARSTEAKEQGLGSGDAYSNFHCDIDEIGAYRHSQNYLPILNRDIIGIHLVPLVHCTYLVRRNIIPHLDYLLNSSNYEYRNFSISAVNNSIHQYLDNRKVYGYLSLLDDAETSREKLPSLSWYSEVGSKISFKVFNCGDDSRRSLNAMHIHKSFAKHFSPLISQTHCFKTINDVKVFMRENKEFRVSSNRDYPGWKPGALGVWASWYSALRIFLQTDQEAILLLEDDLWFTEKLFDQIPVAYSDLPDNWELLTLFSPEPEWELCDGKTIGTSGILTKRFGTWSAAAIMFSREGAKRVIQYIESGISEQCDLFIFNKHEENLNGFALLPQAMLEAVSIYNWESWIGPLLTDLIATEDLI